MQVYSLVERICVAESLVFGSHWDTIGTHGRQEMRAMNRFAASRAGFLGSRSPSGFGIRHRLPRKYCSACDLPGPQRECGRSLALEELL